MTTARARPTSVFALGVPILGICYGQQVMMQMLGGMVEGGKISGGGGTAEFGRAFVAPTADHIALLDGWFQGDDDREQVWMSHGDHVSRLAPGFEVFGTSPNAPYAITADVSRNFYAVQFHPEVHHTPRGAKLYENFVRLAGFTGDWTMGAYRDQAIRAIRDQVGDKRVICGLSGGVDSSVAAVLIHEAIGDQPHLRLRRPTGCCAKARPRRSSPCSATPTTSPSSTPTKASLFLGELDGESPTPRPSARPSVASSSTSSRNTRTRSKVPNSLAQGTLYPDVIESVSFSGGPSVTIKSHHNVGGLPEKMGLKLVEPLRELFKDEVRALGRELGLPQSFIGRHPFPGPGLAIRCPGEITREKLDILRKADAVYIDQIRRHGLYDEIWQAFRRHPARPARWVLWATGAHTTLPAPCAR